MFYCPPKYETNLPNVNLELSKLTGDLDDITTKITLAKFLRANLGFTTELISGVKLAEYQEILLKAFFNRNYNMVVASRGGSKSFLAAVACFLIPIFTPNTNIIIAGPTFRTARNIFAYMEKISDSKEARLLKQCLGVVSKRNDLFEWKINGGLVRAIPLNGEKVRGLRANVLILDEFLLLSETLIKDVLMPFLVAPSDIKERMIITEREDDLIKRELLKPENRTIFPNTSKMIALTSASYTFENAFRVYSEWYQNITSDKPVGDAKYFVCNLSYQALPAYMVEKSVIEEAKSGGDDDPSFLREYGARFVDGSDSYFSAKKMHDLTVADTEKPTTEIIGNSNSRYVLSIDPSFSNSPTSDNFAFAVAKLDSEEPSKFTLVHNYAVAGGSLKEHIKYFLYLLKAFNVVTIICDNSDGNFIQSANESDIFKKEGIEIKFIDYDGDLQGEDYTKMLRTVRNQYNQENKKICFKQVFTKNSIRRMNEQLQTSINTKKIRFASKLTAHSIAYDDALAVKIPYEFDGKKDILDLISEQDDLIYKVKKEAALIEVKISPEGAQTFDLPTNLKRDNSPNRARRDSYTALLLANEGVKAYNDLMNVNTSKQVTQFKPFFIGQNLR